MSTTTLTREALAELRRLLTDARELADECNPLGDATPTRDDGKLEPWEVVRFGMLCTMASQAQDALHASLDFDTLDALLRTAEGTAQTSIGTPPEDTTP